MEFVNRELKCAECSRLFVFSAAEQQFFRDKGFNHDPKRCKRCKTSGVGGVRVETQVKCPECGIDTTVPFKPTGKRPVLCSSCFKKQLNHPETGIPLVVPADQTE
jgi:CxxC-x17-CxxC domain-containing protein